MTETFRGGGGRNLRRRLKEQASMLPDRVLPDGRSPKQPIPADPLIGCCGLEASGRTAKPGLRGLFGVCPLDAATGMSCCTPKKSESAFPHHDAMGWRGWQQRGLLGRKSHWKRWKVDKLQRWNPRGVIFLARNGKLQSRTQMNSPRCSTRRISIVAPGILTLPARSPCRFETNTGSLGRIETKITCPSCFGNASSMAQRGC